MYHRKFVGLRRRRDRTRGRDDRCSRFKSHPNRRGTLILIVMLCLLVTMMISTTLLRSARLQVQQVEREELRMQASWIADSAIGRAAAKLQSESETDYSGETWQPQVGAGKSAARVEIDVQREGTGTDSRGDVIHVVADVSEGHRPRVRVSKRISLNDE